MDKGLMLIMFTIFVALIFDYINGFHDAANSIATVVSTRVLSPGTAVIWAAFFNFVAAFFFGTHVASTIGKGMVLPGGITTIVILSSLIGAITWNLITWYWGLPSSSSHALIGGFGGAALVHAGPQVLIWAGFRKTILFIFIAPLLGMVLAFLLMLVMMWLNRKTHPSVVDKRFRVIQLFSASLYSLGHGSNDAQKTMGIIMALLISGGYYKENDPMHWWIIFACYAAIALGTLSGGWRIVKTMGQKITKLRPIGGVCAETAGATSIFLATYLGIPVSTTHVITGAIMGVGATNKLSAVKWGVAENIIWAWLLTIPTAGLIAAACQWTFQQFGI